MPPEDSILRVPFRYKAWKFEKIDKWHKLEIPANAVKVYLENKESVAGRDFWVSYKEEKNDEDYYELTATGAKSSREYKLSDGYMPKVLWIKAAVADTWLWYEIWAPK